MLFFDRLEDYGHSVSVISESGRMCSYAELTAMADAVAAETLPRDLVFLLCENSLGSLAGYVGFLRRRVVPLLLDSTMDEGLLTQLIQTYHPTYLYVPERLADRFADLPQLHHAQGYILLKTNSQIRYTLHEDLALLLTTSGSTGSPKLVRQSARNIDSNARAIADYLDITSQERPITTLPMHYTYGLSVINSHLLSGATLLMTGRGLMEKDFWTFLRDQGATSIAGVPYTYEMLKRLRFFNMQLPALHTMTQAGGKLQPELAREFAEFALDRGIRFFIMYGQTEATARMSYLPPERSVEKYASIGVAIPGGQFSLIDDGGATIDAVDVVGELVYRGSNVTLGYAQCLEDLSKGDENYGVLVTGDMARRDSDGFYYITGRKKRFIKLFGNRMNLDEAEQLVKTLMIDCACVGQDDHMVIYVTDGSRSQEVQKFLAEKTGIHPVAFEVRTISEIPKSASGKTEYTKLQ